MTGPRTIETPIDATPWRAVNGSTSAASLRTVADELNWRLERKFARGRRRRAVGPVKPVDLASPADGSRPPPEGADGGPEAAWRAFMKSEGLL